MKAKYNRVDNIHPITEIAIIGDMSFGVSLNSMRGAFLCEGICCAHAVQVCCFGQRQTTVTILRDALKA